MCAFKEEERSVLISVTNERNYRVQNCANYWHHDLYVSEGSNHVTASFLNCVFVYFNFFFWPSAFLVFFLLLFLFSVFLPSAFFYPHFPIRIRHPQVSGPRLTDTRWVIRFHLPLAELAYFRCTTLALRYELFVRFTRVTL